MPATTMDDSTLLKQFLATRDERAFAELVRRHVDLVYSAARRQVRDDAAAHDVTQQVFVLLAEKARTIRDGEAVAGWLLAATRYVALNSMRTEIRRRRHEREAAVMHEKRRSTSDEPAWEAVGPMLDQVVAKLKREDRDALALRYFQGRSVADVAAALGVSQEAAQKRLSRALERLREMFARRGVKTTADALSSVLMANALIVAPATLGTSVAGAALTAATAATAASGAAAGGTIKGATAAIMAMAKTKIVAASVAAVMLVGVTGTIAYQQIRTPGGKGRQVRVDPAIAAAASRPQVTVEVKLDPAWRTRFDAVYALKPNETLKRVPKPWIAERRTFYRTTNSTAQVELDPQGPSTMRIAQEADGTLMWEQMIFGGDEQVRWALRHVVGVSPQQVDLPPRVLSTRLPGDWVYRPSASVDVRMKEFAGVLSAALKQPYAFALEPREREAIVITGTYEFRPLEGAKQEPGRTIHLSLSKPTTQPSFSGAGGGMHEVFEHVGDLTNLPVVMETTLPQRGAAQNWKIDRSLSAYMGGKKPMDAATVDVLLATVAKQTSLELKRARRVVPTWVVVNGG